MPKKRKLLAIVCNYSVDCDGNCEKCRWLREIKIVDLADLKVPTFEEKGCECNA